MTMIDLLSLIKFDLIIPILVFLLFISWFRLYKFKKFLTALENESSQISLWSKEDEDFDTLKNNSFYTQIKAVIENELYVYKNISFILLSKSPQEALMVSAKEKIENHDSYKYVNIFQTIFLVITLSIIILSFMNFADNINNDNLGIDKIKNHLISVEEKAEISKLIIANNLYRASVGFVSILFVLPLILIVELLIFKTMNELMNKTLQKMGINFSSINQRAVLRSTIMLDMQHKQNELLEKILVEMKQKKLS